MYDSWVKKSKYIAKFNFFIIYKCYYCEINKKDCKCSFSFVKCSECVCYSSCYKFDFNINELQQIIKKKERFKKEKEKVFTYAVCIYYLRK